MTKSIYQTRTGTASPVSSSNVDHGKALLDGLHSANCIFRQPAMSGDSVLSYEIVEEAEQLHRDQRNEKYLVNLYSPFIQSIVEEVDTRVTLVNNEEYSWLRSSSDHRNCDMKSDLFIAYHALVEKKEPYRGSLDANIVYGRFPCWNCRSSLWCLFDAKWKIDEAAFGEKCKYLQSCRSHIPGVNQKLKLILFDIEEFWMIEGHGMSITKLTKCSWTQSGSREVLKQFIRTFDPWMDNIERILAHKSYQFSDETPILGAGAYGRAFYLNTGQVLKVVVSKYAAELETEYSIIRTLQERENTRNFVIPVVPDSFGSFLDDEQKLYCAWYVLESRGDPLSYTCPRLSRSTTPTSFPGTLENSLVYFLYDFHLTGHVHRDARLDNVLLKDGSLKWIDLRSPSPANFDARVNDFVTLFGSLTGADQSVISPRIRNILVQPSTSDEHKEGLSSYLRALWAN